MGEDFEAVVAGNGHERHASFIRHTDRKRRRCRDGDDDRRSDRGRLLHHLDRHATGQHDQALLRRVVVARERATELVERVMTSNVFPERDKASGDVPECRSMHRAGLVIDRLRRAQGIRAPP